MPKGVTQTIESMRVKDETIITDADDDELIGEQNIDEFASYFNNETTPRIIMTTNRRPNGVSYLVLARIQKEFDCLCCDFLENFRLHEGG